MRAATLLGRLIGRQGGVLVLLVLVVVVAGLVVLPPVAERDAFLALLLALSGGAAVVLLLLVRAESDRLERAARDLAAALDRFEPDVGPAADGPAGDALDAAADACDRLRARLGRRIAALEEDREQLRAVLSGMVEGVVALDVDQAILFANERAAKLLGVDRDHLVGRRLWEVVRQRPLLDVVREALAGREPRQEEVFWDGDADRSLTVHAAALSGGPDDSPRGAVVVLHDTSALRRLERLRQEFVANVSHELKTPLSVIAACVETLLDRGAIEDAQHRGRFLEQIAAQAQRLHVLILDLLALARIESGDSMFDFGPVPLWLFVESCLEVHLPRAAAKRQTLVLAVAPELRDLEVWADEESLSQILHNLLDNAVKYTPEGGRIEVAWRPTGGQVALTVTDDGHGIPEADLPRIFERFYRVDKARSRELGGTGLGLAIVKHLAQEMGGSVDATSTPGRGACFVVTLPGVPQPGRREV